MNYSFPQIRHISDVLPAIEGRDEFIVVRKDGYQVVNYAVMMEDSFPPVESSLDALRRECRGLIFDEAGKVMSRRYHKFFNVNERDETRMEHVDWSRPHRILEKLDGSMISPILVRDHLRWTTKMGITDTAMQAEVFVARNPQYADFARQCLAAGVTPIFEWCSNQNRIVLSYPEDRLILTGVRDNLDGTYMDYDTMVGVGHYWHIPVVVAHAITEDLIRTIAAWEGSEGVVVRFDDGHMLKVKAEWYVLRHKSKDAITREKNVLDYIVNDHADDVMPFLQVEDQERLVAFRDRFWQGVDAAVRRYESYWGNVQAAGLDRKQFALQWKPTIEQQDSFAPAYVFGRFGDKDGREMVVDHIRKNIGTQTKIDALRQVWGGHRWEYTFDGDA